MSRMIFQSRARADAFIKTCPVCGGSTYRKLFTKKGRSFWRCRSCSSVRQHPLPSSEDLAYYYESSHNDGMYRDFIDAHRIKEATARARMEIVGKWLKGKSVLDVGCSTGAFIAVAMERGWQCTGVDLSERAVTVAREAGLEVAQGHLENLKDEATPVDNITAFDVIEHVRDPRGFAKAAAEHLTNGGRLILSLPDEGHWSRWLMGRRWYFYIPDEHLFYFRRKAVRVLLESVGFRVLLVGSAVKILNWRYSLIQFREYNPTVYRVLKMFDLLLPCRMRDRHFGLNIGEILVIAERP